MATDQAQIVRFLEALNEGDPAEMLRRSLQSDALDWVQRGLGYGARLGLGPDAATRILIEVLEAIPAAVADRLRREGSEGRSSGDAGLPRLPRRGAGSGDAG